MHYGLQTHFNAPIDDQTLRDLVALHFTSVRVDAQVCAVEVLLDIVESCQGVGLVPLVTIASLDRFARLPPDLDLEWTNEPDGDVWPAEFRIGLDEACAAAEACGQRLWAPAISNLDWNSLGWLAALRGPGWPAGLYGLSAHRYGDGTFEKPHDGFKSRIEEVAALCSLCDGRPFLISEWGYPSPDLTEAAQADCFMQEWAFWRDQGAAGSFAFQLNDGTAADEHYGIRRRDGTWKPCALTVPVEGGDMTENTLANLCADAVFVRQDLVALEGRPDEYSLRYPIGADTILSPKKDGRHELRPMSSAGHADETCRILGGCVVFPNVAGVRLAWRLVDA